VNCEQVGQTLIWSRTVDEAETIVPAEYSNLVRWCKRFKDVSYNAGIVAGAFFVAGSILLFIWITSIVEEFSTVIPANQLLQWGYASMAAGALALVFAASIRLLSIGLIRYVQQPADD
jgi:hypothetical protein